MEEDGAQRRRVLLEENSMEIFNLRMKCESNDFSVQDDLTKNASQLHSQYREMSIYNVKEENSKAPSQVNILDQTFRKQSINSTQFNPQIEDKIKQTHLSSFQQPQKLYFSELSAPLKNKSSQIQSYESLPQINAEFITSKNDFLKSIGNKIQEFSPKGLSVQKSLGNGTKEDKKTSAQHIDKLQVDLKKDISNMKRKSRKQNQFSLFNRTNLVKKFITTLLSKTQSYLFKNLSKHQLGVIDDKSCNYEYFLEKKMIKDEESIVSFIWEFLNLLISIFLIFTIPYFVNFKSSFSMNNLSLTGLTIITLVLDILIKTNKAIYKRGMIIVMRDQIFKNFLKKEALLDFTVLIIYSISQIFDDLDYLEYIIILRVISVINILKGLFQKYDQECKYSILVKISVLVIIILSFGNIQGSIFVKIALQNQGFGKKTWLTQIPLSSSDSDVYIAGLYWSTITMATIGYGDIHPTNSQEMVYASVVSLISCGIFGYSISQIGEIVAAIQERKENFNKKMLILNRQMNQRQLNKKLQHQVRNYYEYLHKEESLDEEDASQMINNLPSSMREAITFDMNHKLLYEQKLFYLNFSKEFLNKLSLNMKQIKIGPEIQLFNENDFDQKLYFILKGSVEMYIHMNNTIKSCKILKKGDLIGEVEFFSQSYRRFSSKTLNVVKLMVIEFSDFYKCIKSFKEDFEKYNEIKDKVGLYKDSTNLDRRCQSCGKFTHQFTNCPSLLFVPNYHKVIHQHNYSESHERKQQKRQFDSKSNTKSMHRKVKIIVELYQKMNNIQQVNPSDEQLYDSDMSHMEYIQQQTEGYALNQQAEEQSESVSLPARKKAYTQIEIDIKRRQERKNTKKSTFHKETQDFKNNFEKMISIDEKLVENTPTRARQRSLMAQEYEEKEREQSYQMKYINQNVVGTQLMLPANSQTNQVSTQAGQSQSNIQRQPSLGQQGSNYNPTIQNNSINIEVPITPMKPFLQLNNFANSLTYIPQHNELNVKIDSGENPNSRYDKQQTNMSSRSHFQNPNNLYYQNQSHQYIPNISNNILIQQQKQFYPILNFDTQRDYKKYFPHNNFSKILRALKSVQTQQTQKQKIIKKKKIKNKLERKGVRIVSAGKIKSNKEILFQSSSNNKQSTSNFNNNNSSNNNNNNNNYSNSNNNKSNQNKSRNSNNNNNNNSNSINNKQQNSPHLVHQVESIKN